MNEPKIVEDKNSTELVKSYKPAAINADFEAMRKKLDQMILPYKNLDESALALMDAKEAKVCRADLNKIIASVEDGRKAIKKAINEPYSEFEGKVKELLEPARTAVTTIDGYVKAQEEIERQTRLDALQEIYEDYAPALVPVVPFSRILETQWLNKSFGEKKAEDALTDKVSGIAADWESMKATQYAFPAETEAEFFRTLSLRVANEFDASRKAEQARIDTLKADVAETRAEDIIEPPQPVPVVGPDLQLHRWTLHIEFIGDKSLAVALVGALKSLGITGGTVKDEGVIDYE